MYSYYKTSAKYGVPLHQAPVGTNSVKTHTPTEPTGYGKVPVEIVVGVALLALENRRCRVVSMRGLA